MTTWMIVRKSDLAILGWYAADVKDDGLANRSYDTAEPIAAHLALPDGMQPDIVKCDSLDGTFEYDQTKISARTNAQWAALRAERDSLLSACDWTQLSDSPLSSDKKAEFVTYRQALRNLPQNTEDPGNPTWPTVPSYP